MHEARITVIDGSSVAPRHLNKHIDYDVVPSPAGTKEKSLATPVGMVVSPDGQTLYHTDTLAGIIYAFDRGRSGTLTNKRVFVRFSPDEGYPDGPIVDAEGCLWTGLFGGWGLRRYSPKGELLQTLRLPCSAVTKAAFGGDDLRTLYITTAHVALNAEQRQQQPLAGGLFSARIDVPGLPQGIVTHGI